VSTVAHDLKRLLIVVDFRKPASLLQRF